jgi:hypothetical protein
MMVGLDPHVGEGRWWVYDFFAEGLQLDRAGSRSSRTPERWMQWAGFSRIGTSEAEHFAFDMPVSVAERQGSLQRTSTSQSMVIKDEEFERGRQRILEASACHRRGELLLRTDKRRYATVSWLP